MAAAAEGSPLCRSEYGADVVSGREADRLSGATMRARKKGYRSCTRCGRVGRPPGGRGTPTSTTIPRPAPDATNRLTAVEKGLACARVEVRAAMAETPFSGRA